MDNRDGWTVSQGNPFSQRDLMIIYKYIYIYIYIYMCVCVCVCVCLRGGYPNVEIIRPRRNYIAQNVFSPLAYSGKIASKVNIPFNFRFKFPKM